MADLCTDYDFECEDRGTLAIIRPITREAQGWLADNVEGRGPACSSEPLVGEPRFMLDIALAMLRDGLTCMNGEIALSLD